MSNWSRINPADTGTAGTPSSAVYSVQAPADGATLTKAAVTMTGASGVLVAASATRTIVIVSNAAANAAAAIDPTGGTAVLTAGIALAAGQTLEITGKAAQSAMTQIGTNAQVLTVYTGA
jgi:hypothetical protein